MSLATTQPDTRREHEKCLSRESFDSLFEQYRGFVFRICRRYTRNAADAEDACQETFLLLYRNLDRYRADGNFTGWLASIATHCSFDLARRARARPSLSLETVLEQAPESDARKELPDPAAEMPFERIAREELRREVREAIAKLSPKLRVVTVLRHLWGLRYEEVAERLGLSIGTVKSRLHRAHAAMHHSLECARLRRSA